MILKSPLITNFKNKVGLNVEPVNLVLNKLHSSTIPITKKLFGITAHGVFIDNVHYNGYSHIIAIVYKDKNDKEISIERYKRKNYCDSR